MFEKIIKFFIDNYKLNYVMFGAVIVVGVLLYQKLPKEIFPNFKLDIIAISGEYVGASAEILDNMAVRSIEDGVKNIVGVKNISTTINPGNFSIILEIKHGFDINEISNKIKNAININKKNLPSDMNKPIVNIIDPSADLVSVVISSDHISLDKLKEISKEFKNILSSVKNISQIDIFGSSKMQYEILLDNSKIDIYGLSKQDLFNAIGRISYIFPIGKVEDSGNHFYISTNNGKKTEVSLEDTIIKLGNKQIYLSDIATISKKYKRSNTLYSYNSNNAIGLSIKQSHLGNAVDIVGNIKNIVDEFSIKYPNIIFKISNDNSVRISNRLRVIFLNILFGIFTITLMVVFLINWRVSLLVGIGIPTSFVLGIIYFYFTGYTINVITLIGILLAIGILVDDAIVVSENIQYYTEQGYTAKDAAISGTKEMFKPVLVASLTTLFAFMPLIMIPGTLGEVVKLIPITFSILIVASLFETFIFLPVHSTHILKSNARVKSWDKAYNIYKLILHMLMPRRKLFVISYVLITISLIVLLVSLSRFQMFESYDSQTISISIKSNVNTKLEESFSIVKIIEKDLLENKNLFSIEDIESIAGFRINSVGRAENYPYVMYIKVALKDSDNRDKTSILLSAEIRDFLNKQNYVKNFNLENISVLENKTGQPGTDISIKLSSSSNDKTIKAINKIKNKIEQIDGVNSISSSPILGVKEMKIKISPYGESLGVDEGVIGSILSNLYLGKQKSIIFDDKDVLSVNIKSIDKDKLASLKNITILLKDGKRVSLEDVCQFDEIEAYEKIIKSNGEASFYLYANVNTKIVTATEVLKKLKEIISEVESSGVKVELKGENEQKKELGDSLGITVLVAMFLIFLSLLYLFDSVIDSLVVLSVIPFSVLGVLIGHFIMGLNISLPTIIGTLGLAGVVINDGIIMMVYLRRSKNIKEVYINANKRLRPIVITSITTLAGMSSLILFPSGEAVVFQSMAVALGFGLAWGTIINLLYLPNLFILIKRMK
jgi:multidrug efflux pump subunit AcrB